MEHIVQFAVSMDDERITKAVEEKAEKVIINDIKEEVLRNMFIARSYSGMVNPKTDSLQQRAWDIFHQIIESRIDDIINLAAEHLADKVYRSKKFKEYLETVDLGDLLRKEIEMEVEYEVH